MRVRAVSRQFHDRFVAATKSKPQQTVDTASPRGTLSLFLASMNEIYDNMRKTSDVNRSDPKYDPLTQRALSCLDVSELPEYSRDYHASEAAVCIKEILDRVPLPPMEDVPGVESLEGSENDEKLIQWQIPKTELTIARVQEGPRRGAFLFSPETVRRAVEFYDNVRGRPYRTDGTATSKGLHDWWLSSPGNSTVAALVARLPNTFQNRRFGLAVWQWTGLLIVDSDRIHLDVLALRIGRVRGEQTRERNLAPILDELALPHRCDACASDAQTRRVRVSDDPRPCVVRHRLRGRSRVPARPAGRDRRRLQPDRGNDRRSAEHSRAGSGRSADPNRRSLGRSCCGGDRVPGRGTLPRLPAERRFSPAPESAVWRSRWPARVCSKDCLAP